jgi:hypothetical protein
VSALEFTSKIARIELQDLFQKFVFEQHILSLYS